MNCPHCNAPLAPGSGFCGSCGQRVQQPGQPPPGQPQPQGWGQGSQPPQQGWQQQQGQPQPGWPQTQGQAPGQQQGWGQQPQPGQAQQWQQPGQSQPGQPQQWQQPGQAQPGQPQQWQQPGEPQPGQPQQWQQPGQPPGQAQGQWQQPPGGFVIRPFPIIMQQRLTRLTGQLFLAPQRLFFVCESQKGGLGIALGRGFGGLIGGAIAAALAPTPGQAAPVVDEPMLFQAVQQMPGSMVMEPPQFKAIKHTMWTRGIFYGGKTYALPDGLGKELRRELGLWCQANNVRQAGLIK